MQINRGIAFLLVSVSIFLVPIIHSQSSPKDCSEILAQSQSDQSNEACACITGTDWHSSGGCCGNTQDDCGITQSGLLCSIDSSFQSSAWILAEQALADIKYIGCSNQEYLSDGIDWTECNGNFWRETINNNDFICIGKGRESIVECCGDGSCQSSSDGKRLVTGEFINPAEFGGPTGIVTGTTTQSGITAAYGLKPTVGIAFSESCKDPNPKAKLTNGVGQTDWATDDNGNNPDCGKIFLSTASETGGKDYRFGMQLTQAVNGICSEEKAGTISYTPWASDDGGEAPWAKASDSKSFDCGRLIIEERELPDKSVTELKLGIKFADHSSCTNSGSFEFTGFASLGDSESNWASDDNEFDPNCAKLKLEAALDDFAEINLAGNTFTIAVAANLDGKPWPGSVIGTYIHDSEPEKQFTGNDLTELTDMPFGTYTFGYVSGAPVNAFLQSITFNPSKDSVKPGDILTVIYNFQGVVEQENITYYCQSDSKFAADLDVPEAETTCALAGFIWTGSKCCSEDDDQNEYYNDKGGTGGCWNKEAILSASFLNASNDIFDIVNVNGTFYGCALDQINYVTETNLYLNILDTHTSQQLINNKAYCTEVEGYYCSYKEEWTQSDGIARKLSNAPIGLTAEQAAECCAVNQCWDGSACMEQQNDDPLSQPVVDNLRCVNGEWTPSTLKFTPDGTLSGYCPEETQCLFDPQGDANDNGNPQGNPQCINNTQFIKEDYCDSGVWSSRTKLLAMQLLNHAVTDYILFCDDKENALNYLTYLTGSGESASAILEANTNNFCVLSSGDEILLGTSLNIGQDKSTLEGLFNNLFDVASCVIINDGLYHECDSSFTLWYNNKTNSIIYSKNAIILDPPELTLLSEFLENEIGSVIAGIENTIQEPPFDDSYINFIKKFSRIFFSNIGTKSLVGAIEGKNYKNAVAKYINFNADICSFADRYSEDNGDAASGIACGSEAGNAGNNYYVLIQGSQLTRLNPDAIWPDFTSKLRLGGT